MRKFNKKFLLFFVATFLFLATATQAASTDEVAGAFRQYKDVQNLNILVPTVVELPIENAYLERLDFAVFDKAMNLFLPYFYKKNTIINDVNYYATTIPSVASSYSMVDKNLNTYTEFVLDKDDKGTVTITLRSSSPITSSAIMVLLDKNIALPTSVELSALVDYQFKKLLARK